MLMPSKTQGNRNKVTMSDIARSTGYSVNTVSHALNGIDDVRESTKKLILSTAKKLGYIPNSAAISMRNGKTMAVAAIIPDITGLYFPIMVKLLENRLRALGYDLIIMNTSENPDQELQCVTSALSKNVDGVIICPSMHNCDALDLMERHGVPFVLMGRYFRDRSYESVVADDFRSGYLLTDHMIGLGHTKIAYIGASTHVSSSAERLEGYRAALSAHGIVPDDRLVRICMKTSQPRRSKLRSTGLTAPRCSASAICSAGTLQAFLPDTGSEYPTASQWAELTICCHTSSFLLISHRSTARRSRWRTA